MTLTAADMEKVEEKVADAFKFHKRLWALVMVLSFAAGGFVTYLGTFRFARTKLVEETVEHFKKDQTSGAALYIEILDKYARASEEVSRQIEVARQHGKEAKTVGAEITARLTVLGQRLDVVEGSVTALESIDAVQLQSRVGEIRGQIDEFQKLLDANPDTEKFLDRLALQANIAFSADYIKTESVEWVTQGYMDYSAPSGYKVVGAGGWSSGGAPLPIRFNYPGRDADVTSWAGGPNGNGHHLSVVLLRVSN